MNKKGALTHSPTNQPTNQRNQPKFQNEQSRLVYSFAKCFLLLFIHRVCVCVFFYYVDMEIKKFQVHNYVIHAVIKLIAFECRRRKKIIYFSAEKRKKEEEEVG